MNPVIRIVLEKTIEAIMDAGYHPSDFENTKTGVFCAFSIYGRYATSLMKSSDPIIGAHDSMIAKRISYCLKLKGPAYQLDAACSGSVFALESAYRAITEGKCDKAFVCGVHLCLQPGITLQFMSRDGRSKTFDDSADGFASGEGIVTILLERARDAKRVYAEVIHVKTNCDGFKDEGMICPSVKDQSDLFSSFYEECEMDSSIVTFIEAHGTGTRIGDLVELNAIDSVFSENRDRPLYIGTVKTNIGHTEGASGLGAVIKAIISFETNYIPPNINYKNPRKTAEGLEKGRLLVVTEKTILPDQNGLIGIINLGMGGTNAHTLLRWNSKTKVKKGQPVDDFPRLLCVSGRVSKSIDVILDDFKKKSCNTEYAYLVHQAFRKLYAEHVFRGYGIYTIQGELKRSIKRLQQTQKKLCLVFTNYDKVADCLKLGKELMKITIFSKSINNMQSILFGITNINLVDILDNCKDVTLTETEENLLKIAIQIGLAQIIKEIKLIPNQMFGTGYGELLAAYADDYLTLEEVILEGYQLINKPNKHYGSYLDKRGQILAKRRDYLDKRSSINKKFSKKIIPTDVISIIVGGETDDASNSTINLVHEANGDYILSFLMSLGRLYEHGFSMELDKLYGAAELPVSRGTPMLSPLIKWYHTKNFEVYPNENESKDDIKCRIVKITPKSEEWRYITDHMVDGMNLFPGSGYLVLAWETLAKILDKSISKMKIVFEDVKFLRATNLLQQHALELIVMIQLGTNIFEITEGTTTLVSGKIYEAETEDVFVDIPTVVDKDELCMNSEDIYKEFRLRGYQYRSAFSNVKKSNIEGTQATVEWTDNWVTYIDNILQVALLPLQSRGIHLQTTIQRLLIDAPEHFKRINAFNNMVPVSIDKQKSVLKAAGIEGRGIGVTCTNKRKQPKPVLEVSKFVPNIAQIDGSNTIRSFVHLILENVNLNKISVIEDCLHTQNKHVLINSQILQVLNDIPLIKQEIIVITKTPMNLEGVTIQTQALNRKNSCLILIVSGLLETVQVSTALDVINGAKGFIISREHANANILKFSNTPFKVLCAHRNDNETLVLLRARQKDIPRRFFEISNDLNDFRWISKLQVLLKEDSKVVLYAQNKNPSGILGLTHCLKKEYSAEKICLVFLMDDAPKLDPELEFYKEQLDKNLVINIWKDGAWGTYRHLPLPDNQLVESEHCYVNVIKKGDLSSTSWIEGRLSRDDFNAVEEGGIVHIYYTPLNFKDFVIASGTLSPDDVTRDDINDDCIQGFEFVGRTSRGQRVMGMCPHGALSTLKHDSCLLPIPDEWSMEDAGTIVTVYTTVIEALINRSHVEPGKSILIHSACGGIGLAAINLSLFFKLNIFVTVGTAEKRDFIRNKYPQIKAEHIGNSRSTSFEEMVHKYTNGKGVHYVLSSLSEEKLLASIRCLATGGKFIELGRLSLINNTALSVHLLEKQGEFIGISVDKLFYGTRKALEVRKEQIMNLIRNGAIKPLPRTVFQVQDVEKALRYLGSGQNIGKILIQMREEEKEKICPVPRVSFKGIPRFYCKPECSYLLCGGLGGFGLELANLLITRGAKKLVLTSKSGVCNGYQKYRIRMWQNYDVSIITSTNTGTTEQDCINLLEKANRLGPVDGIFNLAAVFKDAIFENHRFEDFREVFLPKASCTQHLDKISRILCPQLRYFVAFSSYASERGHAGQTSYAMANSIMERICEKRKQEGYPGLAIQWGLIGDVGIVTQLQKDDQELVIGGLQQQRMSSCLDVMDKLLKQNETIVASMLVAEKKHSSKNRNLFDSIVKMMGITDLGTVSMHFTLSELGADSIMVIEIKQTLEQEYEIFLTVKEIRGLTFFKLKELSRNPNSETPCMSEDQNDIPQGCLDYLPNTQH